MGTIFSLQIKVMEKNILLTETKPCINPECQRIKMGLVKTLGIEDFELWKCPEEYIHLLHVGKNNKTYKV